MVPGDWQPARAARKRRKAAGAVAVRTVQTRARSTIAASSPNRFSLLRNDAVDDSVAVATGDGSTAGAVSTDGAAPPAADLLAVGSTPAGPREGGRAAPALSGVVMAGGGQQQQCIDMDMGDVSPPGDTPSAPPHTLPSLIV
jgi:hypothetical protein